MPDVKLEVAERFAPLHAANSAASKVLIRVLRHEVRREHGQKLGCLSEVDFRGVPPENSRFLGRSGSAPDQLWMLCERSLFGVGQIS
ncbi:hypothetical protein [Paraburkholderia tropica]|uniref:hypothetical protein n=1 Tax=Paraburkholderia tropica TaxID=92647 RepID=UPI0011B59FA8|nr:hypothetical protein [Paraburkholderia tropica]MBB3001268.1 hypothetical protein [Paraburkholderia tropica]MBB6320900.1 hypothetical protein [Paraburkholderia tropica]MDE1140656.1 hypothetical protein [Paraburkholderia tropica]